MTDINTVTIVGRVVKDVEVKYTAKGTAMIKFALAVNESRNNNGQWVDFGHFFDVVAWGKMAENLGKLLTKGKQIVVEGRLNQERWQAQDGTARSSVSIAANNIQLCGPRDNNAAPAHNNGGDFPDNIEF